MIEKRKYQGFTLVEMLIVMGILSVLMGIGVSVARFAVQRANNIQHQSAVDQFFQAMQSHYTDQRRYPTTAEMQATSEMGLVGGGPIDIYVDANFDGGAPARYYYFAGTDTYPQSFLVCVSFVEAGAIATSDQGGYCNGNGFGDATITGGTAISDKTLDAGDIAVGGFQGLVEGQATAGASFDWTGTEWE